ncbi:signal peptide-containing protein [Theileria equi strain WA]|uniref:Signal peptide-containing protein n=1 Tax=Theileria equi strain WA TaxID=1537102 RepID=L0AVV9_THEEQ|nr:signal peptide-containing protein [Theileria equi strain WA]AFZ79685.1 signal peptide-containing protein [Theileria equi strain WA]|eukprot:XP_004829351.1 signal peptide-containing protein [Theileria equi strain WA]
MRCVKVLFLLLLSVFRSCTCIFDLKEYLFPAETQLVNYQEPSTATELIHLKTRDDSETFETYSYRRFRFSIYIRGVGDDREWTLFGKYVTSGHNLFSFGRLNSFSEQASKLEEIDYDRVAFRLCRRYNEGFSELILDREDVKALYTTSCFLAVHCGLYAQPYALSFFCKPEREAEQFGPLREVWEHLKLFFQKEGGLVVREFDRQIVKIFVPCPEQKTVLFRSGRSYPLPLHEEPMKDLPLIPDSFYHVVYFIIAVAYAADILL